MSYQSLLQSSVSSAFKLIGDLASNVTLQRKDTSSFDFGSSSVTETLTTLSVKAVIVDPIKKGEAAVPGTKNVMFKTSDVGDITAYSLMTDSSARVWTIGPVVESSPFVTVVSISREM